MPNVKAWKKMREVCIVGIGLHKFGRWPDKGVGDLGREAIQAALEDAGAEFKDIEAGFSGRVQSVTGTGQQVFGEMGQPGILIDNVEKACASSSTAVRIATWAVGAGLYDVVLCTGVEKMRRGLVTAGGGGPGAPYSYLMGMFLMPAEYAMRARRHIADYGTAPEMFGQVSVKNHKNATMNPMAQYQQALSLEEVMNSRMIADPITLYMCSPTTDGASAAVICAKEVAHRFKGKPITIAGWSSGTPEYNPRSVGGDVSEGFIARLAREAYELASVGPEDIDVAQVHDAFAPGEVFAIEECGFCPSGEGGKFVWEGKANIDGEVPVNTDGGLESRGHPMGATGIAQMAEIVSQLRGEAGPRQVPGNPKVGLTHNVGLGGCNVFILKK
ncbi:MAG: thiolase family protein [Deltaproteobacteria bacterium]|nr:thiolase family protein [Deltaproteobacteria bacterium]MBW2087062.1 thiolase family protein [Deltaproteobacteria bacterium]